MTCRSPGTKSEQSAYSQSIVRMHCKVDLWTKARAQNPLLHTKSGPLSETCSRVASAHSCLFSWGQKIHHHHPMTQMLSSITAKNIFHKNMPLHSPPSRLTAVISKDRAPVLKQQFPSFRRRGRSIRQHAQRKQNLKSAPLRKHWDNTLDQNSSLLSPILDPSDKLPRNPHVP